VVAALSDVSSDGGCSSSNVEALVFGRCACSVPERLAHIMRSCSTSLIETASSKEMTTKSQLKSTTVPDPLREMTAWHDVPAPAIT
jgi:hypothetical protein